MHTQLEKQILAALEEVRLEAGHPETLWHPKFGWVMINNMPTETTADFVRHLEGNGSNRWLT